VSTVWHERSSRSPLSGEAHIDVYLNPQNRTETCGYRAHGADCLCDVDLSKTADITWDDPPDFGRVIGDVEDVIRLGADIWLEYDVGMIPLRVTGKPGREDDPRAYAGSASLSREDMAELIRLVKAGAGWERITKENVSFRSLTRSEYTFIRRALDEVGQKHIFHPVFIQRVIAMHQRGVHLAEITRFASYELGKQMHSAVLGRLLREQGCEPHEAGRGAPGRPVGWAPGCGLSYDEFRRQHGTESED